MNILNALKNDENGFIVSAELVFGWNHLRPRPSATSIRPITTPSPAAKKAKQSAAQTWTSRTNATTAATSTATHQPAANRTVTRPARSDAAHRESLPTPSRHTLLLN